MHIECHGINTTLNTNNRIDTLLSENNYPTIAIYFLRPEFEVLICNYIFRTRALFCVRRLIVFCRTFPVHKFIVNVTETGWYLPCFINILLALNIYRPFSVHLTQYGRPGMVFDTIFLTCTLHLELCGNEVDRTLAIILQTIFAIQGLNDYTKNADGPGVFLNEETTDSDYPRLSSWLWLSA